MKSLTFKARSHHIYPKYVRNAILPFTCISLLFYLHHFIQFKGIISSSLFVTNSIIRCYSANFIHIYYNDTYTCSIHFTSIHLYIHKLSSQFHVLHTMTHPTLLACEVHLMSIPFIILFFPIFIVSAPFLTSTAYFIMPCIGMFLSIDQSSCPTSSTSGYYLLQYISHIII
jgi:hypothetical protein